MDEPQLHKREQQPVARVSGPVADADMRASDADRDRVADILRDALAEGRLTTDEHAERIEALYAAKTMGQLVPLTRDLPAVSGGPAPGPAAQVPVSPVRAESPRVIAVFGGAGRKGRWRVGGEIAAVAVFGGVEIDLTEAVFESRHVHIKVTAVFGGVDIKVPENVTVRGDGGVGIFGGFDVRGYETGDPNAPVVRVSGLALFGGAEVRRKKGKRLKEWARKHLDELGTWHGHGRPPHRSDDERGRRER